ncbi:hypothetical protein KEM55_001488, partial [Ascosphaera atra]
TPAPLAHEEHATALSSLPNWATTAFCCHASNASKGRVLSTHHRSRWVLLPSSHVRATILLMMAESVVPSAGRRVLPTKPCRNDKVSGPLTWRNEALTYLARCANVPEEPVPVLGLKARADGVVPSLAPASVSVPGSAPVPTPAPVPMPAPSLSPGASAAAAPSALPAPAPVSAPVSRVPVS